MKYKRLNFEDYFTICSSNWNGKHIDQEIACYDSIIYYKKGKKYSVDFQIRYDEKRNCIQEIWQQTASKSDWKVNFTFPHKVYDKFTYDGKLIQLKMHRGWSEQYLIAQDVVRAEIKELIEKHPDAYVEVFGWSLGSGLAQIAAEDIYFKFGIKPYLYTYGSVKPFFGKSTYNYVKDCCEEVYNFYDHCDIVGYAVPFLGWRAINHTKVKLEKFCITKLFNPQKYHTQYDTDGLYKDFDKED